MKASIVVLTPVSKDIDVLCDSWQWDGTELEGLAVIEYTFIDDEWYDKVVWPI